MSRLRKSPFLEALSSEVADSLKIGDHLRHDRQFLRSIVALLSLPMLPLRRRRIAAFLNSDVTLVISNPVAHGGRFGHAVLDSLVNMRVRAIGDRRLAEGSIVEEISHFPSLTTRSIDGRVSFGMLVKAMRVRRETGLVLNEFPALSRIYLETLFLIQVIRYCLAEQEVKNFPRDHVWITDFDRHAYARPLIWWANTLGRTTLTMVHGSPNRNYLPPLAAGILVWGEAQEKWFGQASPLTTTHVVGRPELNVVFPPSRPQRLRIMHSLEKLSKGEQRALLQTCAAAKGKNMQVSLRLHPSASESHLDLDWKAISRVCAVEDESRGLLESFDAGDVIVGITSTAVVDALSSGLPAWTVADGNRELPCDLEVMRSASRSLHVEVLGTGSEAPALAVPSEALSSIRSRVVKATGSQAAGLIHESVAKILSKIH